MMLNTGRVIFGLLLFSASNGFAGTARVTAYCYSLQFQRGCDPAQKYSIDISSSSSETNEELALDSVQSGCTHSAFMRMLNLSSAEEIAGRLALDVPRGKDLDGDGFEDFFQAKQGVTNWVTSGAFELPGYGTGPVTAAWNRAQGAVTGTCVLTLTLLPFEVVQVTHPFRILQYSGVLDYSRTATNVSGRLEMELIGRPAETISGLLIFQLSADRPAEELNLEPGTLEKNSTQSLNFSPAIYTRDPRWPTNYFGYFRLIDPSASSGKTCPYGDWLLSIDDPTDSNHNGIPNFSDVLTTMAEPTLHIQSSGPDLTLVVYGGSGTVHEIQTATNLVAPDWKTSFWASITNEPQAFKISNPIPGTTFYRTKVR